LTLQEDVSMVHGVHVNDESRAGRGESDAADYGQRIRRLARDAHRILKSPDGQLDELIELHGRVFGLLNEAHGVRLSGIRRWLLSVREEIGDRLQSWSVEELESLVA
jgi:hypothetical protein